MKERNQSYFAAKSNDNTMRKPYGGIVRFVLAASLTASALPGHQGQEIHYNYPNTDLTISTPIYPEDEAVHAIIEEKEHENLVRAQKSYAALQKFFYDGIHYKETYSPNEDSIYAYNWSYSHVISASLDLHGIPETGDDFLPELEKNIQGLKAYWDHNDKPAYRALASINGKETPEEKFYDDNAWIGLNLMRTFRMTQDSRMLAQAQTLFGSARNGFDSDMQCNTGGVFWVHQNGAVDNRDKNTVSNAPNAQLGLRIFQQTRNLLVLSDSIQMYNWVNEEMKDPDNGLYWDHIDPECQIDTTQWSYNQGTMIGASTLLYRIYGDEYYLQYAEQIAQSAMNQFNMSILLNQEVEFNAIYFRNLLYLAGQTQNEILSNKIQEYINEYADYVWNDSNIHGSNGLFYFKDSERAELIDQAAVVEIFAMLEWDKKDYPLLV